MYKTIDAILAELGEIQSAINDLHGSLHTSEQTKGDEPYDSIEDAYTAIGECIGALECIEQDK